MVNQKMNKEKKYIIEVVDFPQRCRSVSLSLLHIFF